MTVQGYPEYRESGIPWTGDIPATWLTAALKHVVAMKSGEQITAEDMHDGELYPVFGGNGLRGFTASYTHEDTLRLLAGRAHSAETLTMLMGSFGPQSMP